MHSVEPVWRPDKPAFEGLLPEPLQWEALDLDTFLQNLQIQKCEFSEVCRTLSIQETIQSLLCSTAHPLKFFKLELSNQIYFLKFLNHPFAQREECAIEMSSYLTKSGIHVANCLAKLHSPKGCLFFYEWIEGEYLTPNIDIIEQVATEMARLHTCLQAYPSKIVKKEALQRSACLEKLFMDIVSESDNQYASLPVVIKDLLKQEKISVLTDLYENAQVIHGDLNLGNILIEKDTQSIFFLDWEEALSAWFSPLLDVSFVLERGILIHDLENEAELISVFLRAYSKSSVLGPIHQDIAQILKGMAIRALLILIEISYQTDKSLSLEWKKFVSLYKLAKSKQKLLNQVRCQVNHQDL